MVIDGEEETVKVVKNKNLHHFVKKKQFSTEYYHVLESNYVQNTPIGVHMLPQIVNAAPVLLILVKSW